MWLRQTRTIRINPLLTVRKQITRSHLLQNEKHSHRHKQMCLPNRRNLSNRNRSQSKNKFLQNSQSSRNKLCQKKSAPMIPPTNPSQNKVPPPIPGAPVSSANESGPGAAAVPPPIPQKVQQPPPQPPQPVIPSPPKPVQQQQPPPPVPQKAPAPPSNPMQQNQVSKPPPPVPNKGPGAVNKEWPNKAANQIDIFIVSEGGGKIPSTESAVEIEYSGHLPNGKQFIKHKEVIQLGKKTKYQRVGASSHANKSWLTNQTMDSFTLSLWSEGCGCLNSTE